VLLQQTSARKNISVRRKLAAFLLCTVPLSFSVHAQSTSTSPSASPIYKEFVDEAGRTVRVPQSVQRIISLAPSLTETIYALGLQDRLVADTDFCDFPPDAQKKPKVGGGLNPSLEQIVALKPDIVLLAKSFNRIETLQALETLGIPAYGTEPHTVQEIISSTERLANVLGAPEAGSALAADLQRHLADLQQRLSGFPSRRVLFVVWSDPLISVGKDTFIADALKRAGASSIVDSSQDWPQMNLEEVVRLQPDFLVFSGSHSEAGQNDFDVLAERPGWRGLDAVRNRRFAVISDAVNRPAPRIVSAIEDLARQLHPEAFAPHSEDEKEKKTPPRAEPQLSSTAFESRAADPGQMEACPCAP